MNYYNRQIVLILLLTLTTHLAWSCPSDCTCKWKNGKQTIDCSERELLIIPEGMDSGTQVLEFTGNNLQHLRKQTFLKLDLMNLQRIYLSRCRLNEIEVNTFKGLTNLVELDLSQNLLDNVPSETFADCPALMRLTLSSNPIKQIKLSAFGHLPYLNTLELSNCEISYIESGAFQGLTSLEWLYLKGNRLRTLHGLNTLPDSLKGLELQANPWQCDCHLVDLRQWLDTFSMPHAAEPLCAGPIKVTGRKVRGMDIRELACLPDVSPTTFYLEIGEGKNVSLICHVTAIPEARVRWWFQGQLIENDTIIATDTRLLYFIEEGTEKKRSELFIYNTNTFDNGTFICTAENEAGIVHSNFTIRVVLKQEPVRQVETLPLEFLVIIMSATGVSLAAILFALILSILKCHSTARNKQIHRNATMAVKDSLIQDSTDDYSELSKVSSNITLVDRQLSTTAYGTNEDLTEGSLVIEPNLNYCQQSDQNPDLINDTETLGRRLEGDGIEDTVQSIVKDEKQFNNRLSADVHVLNPVTLMNNRHLNNCYRTLPYNRAGKRVHTLHYASETNFAPYITTDIRYTVDGYPVRNCEDSDTDSLRSCSSAPPWPITGTLRSSTTTIAMPLAMRKHMSAQTDLPLPSDLTVNTGVQTTILTETSAIGTHKALNRLVGGVKVGETLTESPDEGYEGEVVEIHTKH